MKPIDMNKPNALNGHVDTGASGRLASAVLGNVPQSGNAQIVQTLQDPGAQFGAPAVASQSNPQGIDAGGRVTGC